MDIYPAPLSIIRSSAERWSSISPGGVRAINAKCPIGCKRLARPQSSARSVDELSSRSEAEQSGRGGPQALAEAEASASASSRLGGRLMERFRG